MYLLLLIFGAFGFVVMTFFGLTHGAGAGHHAGVAGHTPIGGHGHAALPSGHLPAGHIGPHHNAGTVHAPQSSAHGAGHHQVQGAGTSGAWKLLLAISPLDIFSLALGAGAAGVLLAPHVAASELVWCAVAGALVFDFVVVKPLLSLMLRFVSKPSEGLEGQVASIAEAVTAFDHDGKGVVKLCLDGQIVQLLANLEPLERQQGVKVARGDQVLVVEVDSARNTCKVSRELASSPADDAAIYTAQAKR